MITYSQGSKYLAGAAPLDRHVPVPSDSFAPTGIWLEAEQRPEELSVVASIPTVRPLCKQLATSDPGGLPPFARDKFGFSSCAFPQRLVLTLHRPRAAWSDFIRSEGGGEKDAMEGAFCDGRTYAVCDAAQGGLVRRVPSPPNPGPVAMLAKNGK